MPAPVTTTIFLHLATDRDRPYSARRVEDSAWKLSRSRAMAMVLQLHGVYAREAGRGADLWWRVGERTMRLASVKSNTGVCASRT